MSRSELEQVSPHVFDVPRLRDQTELDDRVLGMGGEQLHEWVFELKAWREPHGKEGGEENVDSDVVAEHVGDVHATLMGRRMFSGGEGPW